MAITIQCPGCGRVRTVPDEWAGRAARCNACQTLNAIPPVRPPPPPAFPWQGGHFEAGAASDTALAQPEVPLYPVEALQAPPPLQSPSPPPSGAVASLPTAPPGAGAIDHVMQGMVQAISVRKIGFFLLSALLMSLVAVAFAGMMYLAILLTRNVSPLVFLFLAFVAAIVLAGLSGVAAGGIAHMAHQRASGRLMQCVSRHTGSLMVQFGVSVFFAGVLSTVLLSVVFAALAPTIVTNDPGFFTYVLEGRSPRASTLGLVGDWFRLVCLLLTFVCVLALPIVFWICSFSRYYASCPVCRTRADGHSGP